MLNITDLQQEEFAHAFHWHIEFPSYGSTIFPCTILSDTMLGFTSGSIEHGPGEFHYLKMAMRTGFTCQIFETSDWKVVRWLRDWAKDVLDSDDYTVGLLGDENISREAYLYSLDYQKNYVIFDKLRVIPDGEVSVDKSSNKNDTVNIGVNFVLVGASSTYATG